MARFTAATNTIIQNSHGSPMGRMTFLGRFRYTGSFVTGFRYRFRYSIVANGHFQNPHKFFGQDRFRKNVEHQQGWNGTPTPRHPRPHRGPPGGAAIAPHGPALTLPERLLAVMASAILAR
jgi:hypothetical protein